MIEPHGVAHRLMAALDDGASTGGGSGRLCSACVQVLPVDAAAIMLRSADGWQRTGASDAEAARVEELQVTLGEGPGVEAWRTYGPLLVPDLLADAGTQWPMFAAGRTGELSAVFAFPLQRGAIRLGVLDLYRRSPGRLGAKALEEALAVAEAVTTVLLMSGRGDPMGAPADWLGESPLNRQINQATGMIIAQLGIGAEEAYVRLRGLAFSHNRLVGDVARDVVDRRLRFDDQRD